MHNSSVYNLPILVGEQYVLSAVLSETADTVLYAATQKDMRREVVVESLRPEAMSDHLKVQAFLENARAQSLMSGGSIASSLELVYAHETWHLAKERIEGDPLDVMVAEGRKLSAFAICELMQMLCHICLCMDIEDIAGEPFLMQHLYYTNPGFRLRNPARGGKRGRTTSRRVLTAAAADLMQLVDETSPRAADLCDIMRRMRYPSNWTSLSPLYYDEELVRLQQLFCS
ncbi:MAG: hypothetical protein IKZ13_05570 [Akkermansia sp.]|nr:hypothetical protein [Akkermansia sp.]